MTGCRRWSSSVVDSASVCLWSLWPSCAGSGLVSSDQRVLDRRCDAAASPPVSAHW